MAERNTSPTDILRRYRRNIYPPALDPYQRAVTVHYLEERGYEPRIGVVSGESRLPIDNLVRLAMEEINPHAYEAEFIVGPNSAGLTDGISLYAPTTPQAENPVQNEQM